MRICRCRVKVVSPDGDRVQYGHNIILQKNIRVETVLKEITNQMQLTEIPDVN